MTGNTKVWKILYAGRRGLDRKSKIDKVIGDEVLAILSKDTVWMTHLFSLSREPVTCENAPLCWVSKHFYFSQCFPLISVSVSLNLLNFLGFAFLVRVMYIFLDCFVFLKVIQVLPHLVFLLKVLEVLHEAVWTFVSHCIL